MDDSLSSRIDELLAERRPDRYEVNGGDEWLDHIADEVAHLIPAGEAQFRTARQTVQNREAGKIQKTNKLLRDIYVSGQMPLDWLDTLSLPVAVGKERVALRAMTPKDFRHFASDERRAAASDFTTRNQTCEAAEWIADQMDGGGFAYGRDLVL